MRVTEVESMKAKIVTANGAVIFMERTDAVSDAEWFKALATINREGGAAVAGDRDGTDTLTVPAGGNPVWIKVAGMTMQITPAESGDCDHLTVDVWRSDDEPMAEPWTVEFDGTAARVK